MRNSSHHRAECSWPQNNIRHSFFLVLQKNFAALLFPDLCENDDLLEMWLVKLQTEISSGMLSYHLKKITIFTLYLFVFQGLWDVTNFQCFPKILL